MLGSKWFLVAPALSFVIGAAAPKAKPKPACVVAKEWVTANAANLPRTYSAFEKYDHTVRVAIYLKLSMSDRTALWTEHLNEFLNRQAGLSAEQQAFVREVVVRLPVFINDDLKTGAFKGDAMTERANRLFGNAAAAKMFFNLVTDTDASGEEVIPETTCDCGDGVGCGVLACDFMVNCTVDGSCGLSGCHICSGKC